MRPAHVEALIDERPRWLDVDPELQPWHLLAVLRVLMIPLGEVAAATALALYHIELMSLCPSSSRWASLFLVWNLDAVRYRHVLQACTSRPYLIKASILFFPLHSDHFVVLAESVLHN